MYGLVVLPETTNLLLQINVPHQHQPIAEFLGEMLGIVYHMMQPREKNIFHRRWHTLSTSLTWCRASRAQFAQVQPRGSSVMRMPQLFGPKDYEPVPRDLVTIGFVPEGMEVCSQGMLEKMELQHGKRTTGVQ